MILRKIVRLPAPSEAAAASISRSISSSSGCTARTTKGRVTNIRATTTAVRVSAMWIPIGLSVPVERQQGEAGDDRRQREGQVDDRVDQALARELVADQDPGEDRAEDRVEDDDDQRADHGQFESRLRQRRGDLVPEGAEPAGERFADDGGQRQQHDHAQIEHDRAGAEADADTREANSTSPPGCRYGCCCCRVCLHQPEVETPSSPSIFATEPVSSSKKSSLTLPQPPNWLILNRSFGVGNCFGSTSFGLTGR